MEALDMFFKEVGKMTNEYSQKEKCEMPSLYTKVKENKNFIELIEKMNTGTQIEANDFEEFASQLDIPDSLNKALEEADPKDPLSAIMLTDIPLEIETECVALLRNKLFSLLPTDRDIYAKIFAKELDSKLYCEFDVLSYIYEKGYEIYFLENSITAYMDAVIEVFAEFNIDLVDHLKEESDFEPEFGDYNDFRAKKYANKSKAIEKKTLEGEKPSTEEISETLLSIFKDNKTILNKFLSRIKNKSGVKVIIEVQALMELRKIRNEDVNRPLWSEISKIQNVGTESNWNTVLNSKHTSQVKAIISEYQ